MKTVIINYGAGNVSSVRYALERVGFDALLTSDKDEISTADKVILPGVGSAGQGMNALNDLGLSDLIRSLKQPVLGICLGMQMLCEQLEENRVTGLGIFDVDVPKFKSEVKVPQIGWNKVRDMKGKLLDGVEKGEYLYFVHSYYVPVNSNTTSITNYGGDFSASIQKDNFYGCQFHPEKSGSVGEGILKNFLEL